MYYLYYYFSKINFRFQPKVYDGCHDLIQKAMSFNAVKESDYRICFWYMSKYEAINLFTKALYKVEHYKI